MCLQAGGGMAFTAFSAWIAWSFMYDPWPLASAHTRLTWLGWGLMAAMGVAGLSLLLLGSSRRSFKLGKEGLEATGESNEQGN
jgi:hypothetical protein